MVVNVRLKKKEVCLRKILQSDSKVMYEAELFPAALISMWHPAHVAVFHNGQVVITGVKSTNEAKEIVKLLCQYLDHIYSLS